MQLANNFDLAQIFVQNLKKIYDQTKVKIKVVNTEIKNFLNKQKKKIRTSITVFMDNGAKKTTEAYEKHFVQLKEEVIQLAKKLEADALALQQNKKEALAAKKERLATKKRKLEEKFFKDFIGLGYEEMSLPGYRNVMNASRLRVLSSTPKAHLEK